MRTTYEFRVQEDYAHLLFGPNEGKRLGDGVRMVVLSADDSRVQEVGRLQQELRKTKGRPFFFGWGIDHHYSQEDIATAELFYMKILSGIIPAGNECGTVYDESNVCRHCGAGRRRVSDLVLDLRKAPKSKGIAKTLALDEMIVRQHLAELMIDAKLTGFELGPVRHKARYQDDPIDLTKVPSGHELLRQAQTKGMTRYSPGFCVWLNRPAQKELFERAMQETAELLAEKARRAGKPFPVWYQLVVTSTPVKVVPPTRVGIGPFNDDEAGEYRCPFGHVSGLNLLSEISVARNSWDGSDIVCTDMLLGPPPVPAPRILISPRFYRLLKDNKIRGWEADVAYLR